MLGVSPTHDLQHVEKGPPGVPTSGFLWQTAMIARLNRSMAGPRRDIFSSKDVDPTLSYETVETQLGAKPGCSDGLPGRGIVDAVDAGGTNHDGEENLTGIRPSGTGSRNGRAPSIQCCT